MEPTRKVDVAIIGAAHAGLNAMKAIKRDTDNYLLINEGPLLPATFLPVTLLFPSFLLRL